MGKHLGKHLENMGKHLTHRECKKLKFRTIDKIGDDKNIVGFRPSK
jgi:hypothetical protein